MQRAFPALLIFALLGSSGFALHAWGQYQLHSAQGAAHALQQQRQATAAELSQLQHGLPQIQQDIADFETATLHGWWKAEDRLQFSDSLARLAQSLRLQKLEYGVAPREVFVTVGAGVGAPGGQWLRSPLELQLGLQHEGQLLSFVESFPMLPGGMPVIRECAFSRPQVGAAAANLIALCKGVLYSHVPVPANHKLPSR
jgi:hypothetical protein